MKKCETLRQLNLNCTATKDRWGQEGISIRKDRGVEGLGNPLPGCRNRSIEEPWKRNIHPYFFVFFISWGSQTGASRSGWMHGCMGGRGEGGVAPSYLTQSRPKYRFDSSAFSASFDRRNMTRENRHQEIITIIIVITVERIAVLSKTRKWMCHVTGLTVRVSILIFLYD